MQTINSNSILAVLNTIKHGTFVGVHSLTEPKMRKTNNPFNGHLVQKMTIQTLQFGYSYENAVNNRIEGSGETFVAEPLKWGEWLIPNKVITHKGKLYARFYKVDNSTEPNVTYLIDGVIATDEQEEIIKSFPGVYEPHNLRTRRIGNLIAIESHVRMNGSLSLDEAHERASAIERELKQRFGSATHVTIHMEPTKDKT